MTRFPLFMKSLFIQFYSRKGMKNTTKKGDRQLFKKKVACPLFSKACPLFSKYVYMLYYNFGNVKGGSLGNVPNGK